MVQKKNQLAYYEKMLTPLVIPRNHKVEEALDCMQIIGNLKLNE